MSNTEEIVAYVPFHEPYPTHELVPAEDQPQIPEQVANPCQKQWSGYFEFNPGTDTADMTIEVGADDNAYLTIAQFADTPVNVNPNPSDPNGGGTYRTSSHTFVNAPAGFYYVTISYVNVGGVAVNLSQLTVTVNGEPMVIGHLDDPTAEPVYNLMKKADAQRLMNCYRNYQYSYTDSNGVAIAGKTSAEVYAAVGGNIGPMYGVSGYTNSCALRVTQALCDYGVVLPPEPDLQSNNPNATLDYHNDDNETVYIRAVSVINYLSDVLGQPTFTSYAQFQTWFSELENTDFDIQNDEKPIVIWGEEAGTDHVGMGFSGEGSSSAGAISVAEKIWVLYSPRCADPEVSAL